MLENLTHNHFRKHLSQLFKVRLENSTIDVELISVDTLNSGDSPADRRVPFSLLFRGPAEPILPQMSYPLENEQLGVLEIFLVPVGPDKHGMQYEAIFS